MKKRPRVRDDSDLLDEYDFSSGVRGKYAKRYAKGARRPKLEALLDKSRRQIEEGKGIPHDEFWRQVAERQKAEKRKRMPRRNGGK